jgi:hypothetical protein
VDFSSPLFRGRNSPANTAAGVAGVYHPVRESVNPRRLLPDQKSSIGCAGCRPRQGGGIPRIRSVFPSERQKRRNPLRLENQHDEENPGDHGAGEYDRGGGVVLSYRFLTDLRE